MRTQSRSGSGGIRLNSITFVKAKQLTESKAQALKEVRDAVVEMKQIKTGKKKSRSATEFLNEL